MGKVGHIKEYLPFWENLTEEEIDLIEVSLVNKSFGKGDIISSYVDSCMGMIIVEKGDVRVSIISDDGRQITLFHATDHKVCVMSASCVISQLTFETVIEAVKETHVWVIPSAILTKLSERNIYVKSYMYELLTERFSSVVWVMEQIIFKRVDQRLAGFLIANYEKNKNSELVMTQEEIAAEVNTAREVVARMLKQFAADNLVELKRGRIVLKDVMALKNL